MGKYELSCQEVLLPTTDKQRIGRGANGYLKGVVRFICREYAYMDGASLEEMEAALLAAGITVGEPEDAMDFEALMRMKSPRAFL